MSNVNCPFTHNVLSQLDYLHNLIAVQSACNLYLIFCQNKSEQLATQTEDSGRLCFTMIANAQVLLSPRYAADVFV